MLLGKENVSIGFLREEFHYTSMTCHCIKLNHYEVYFYLFFCVYKLIY